MANKYWVGGSGNTNDTAHWSNTDGGASGASVPTSTDNVIFNANSDSGAGFTVTVNAAFDCADFDNTAVDQVMTLAGSSAMNIYGSLTLKSTTVRTYTGSITFRATATGKTITTNGVVFGASGAGAPMTFNGVGGGWTLGSAITAHSITVTAGSFDSGNYNITTAVVAFNISGSTTRSVALGSSVVDVDTWTATTTTNLTWNAGTSSISVRSNNTTNGGGLTYYNLKWAGGQLAGANTFNNLTIAGPTDSASVGTVASATLSANQTVNGTFNSNLSSTHVNSRVTLRSDIPGTVRTITAAAVTLYATDFQGITIAGAAAPGTGTSLGDAGNNSGITFTSPKTVYAVGTTSYNWSGDKWATSSGGAVSLTNFPIPQDTVIFDNSSANTSATISYNLMFLLPTLDFSARSNAMTFSCDANTVAGITGAVIPNSAITFSLGLYLSLAANQNFNQNGATISGEVRINNPATTLTLASNLTTTGAITFNYGGLALGSYTLTGTTFTANQSATRTLDFGTGKISLTGNSATIVNISPTNMTVSGTPVVECTYSGATGTRAITTGSATEAQSIRFNITAGSDTFNFGPASVVKTLDFTGFSGNWGNAVNALTIYGDLTLASGQTISNNTGAITFGATSGTQTITSNGVTIPRPVTFDGAGGAFALAGALTQGSSRRTTLTNGTLNLAGYTYTAGDFATASGTKNLTFNGGSLVVVASGSTAFNNAQPTNFTTTAGSGNGVVELTSASAKTFVGGGSTYTAAIRVSGSGALSVTGANTFAGATNDNSAAQSILFTAGTTTTFTVAPTWAGASGKLMTIGSITAAGHTLSAAAGIVTAAQYCSISRSTAQGGGVWGAPLIYGNADGGNNSGWNFTFFGKAERDQQLAYMRL